MRIIFAGTPEFARVALEALIHTHHTIVAVYTQPDRESGRGLKLKSSPVKELALTFNIPVYQPQSLKDAFQQEQIKNLQPDVMVVAAFGALIPANILAIPTYGCINIHPSLLPRWRGAAPIQRAIYAGDRISGVTIMQMDAGLDTGPMLLKHEYVLDGDETSQSLHDKLAVLGAESLIEALTLIENNKVKLEKQDNNFATYANKINKEEALIDWSRSAMQLENEVRAFNPWPVSYTTWQGKNLRIWQAKAVLAEKKISPRILVHADKHGLDIATGDGMLRLLAMQLPGGKPISVEDFYNAHYKQLEVGQLFV